MDWWNGILRYQDANFTFESECVASFMAGLNENRLLPQRIDFQNRIDRSELFTFLEQVQSPTSRKSIIFSIKPAGYESLRYESGPFFLLYLLLRIEEFARYLLSVNRACADRRESCDGVQELFVFSSSTLPSFLSHVGKEDRPALFGAVIVDTKIVC
jgi:hypothetical protein